MRSGFARWIVLGMLLPVFLGWGSHAAAQPHIPSKVEIPWNRYYSWEECERIIRDLADAYPELIELRSIGKSVQGRDIWLVIVNPKSGDPHESKPAIYVDGSIHANELQSTEVLLYSIWYLTKSYGRNAVLTEVMDRVAFYFIPVVSPDGRVFWFEEPNTPHSSRHNQRKTDRDLDGLINEDRMNDLDGDGSITQMWKEDPLGRWVRSQTDDRVFIQLRGDQRPAPGVPTYTYLGQEGIDSDDDGRRNEDDLWGDDMNRAWPADWQPTFVQPGSGQWPLNTGETRSIADFIIARTNIVSAQAHHNAGGMVLRGPGTRDRENLYTRADLAVYDELGRLGELVLPMYKYLITYRDLYGVRGGFTHWMFESRGVYAFTIELWTPKRYFYRTDAETFWSWGRGVTQEQEWVWRDKIAFGELYSPLTEVEHPKYGKVLVGGLNKWSSRITPPFMLEEECHRNLAFMVAMAEEMPELEVTRVRTERLDHPGLWEVSVEVSNKRLMPTRSAIQNRNRVGRADIATLHPGDARVVAGGHLGGWHERRFTEQRHEPHRLRVNDGMPGRGSRIFRWIVRGEDGEKLVFSYSAERARDVEKPIRLGE